MDKRDPILLLLSFVLIMFFPAFSQAKTLILDGSLESRIKTVQHISFDVDRDVRSLNFRFAVPASFSNKATYQSIDDLKIEFYPEPASIIDDVDKFGNRFKKVRWENLRQRASIKISFNAGIKSELVSMESAAPFPLAGISQENSKFLKATSMVQSDNNEIISIAKRLTEESKSENDAVNAILNWVSDNVKYTYNPPQFDALYTMRTGKGNCQNFAHLSMALLRAVGIPARIVGGIGLKRQWKVPIEDGFLVQDLGQGGHAWMEIFFPDLGWLSYDPQQTKQFTSTRHIKQTHGLDSKDINDSWSATPYLPAYNESIEASFESDDVNLRLRKSVEAPRSYLMSNDLMAKISPEKPQPPIVKTEPPVKPLPPTLPEPVVKPQPLPVIKPEPVIKPKKKGAVEFGNIEFPALVNIYTSVGNEATKIFDKETAEYVTSRYVYAQAFTVTETMTLRDVSLALRKFGGDGTLYIDIVKDENGKPGFTPAFIGGRSLPIYLSEIKFRPGYYWVDFIFAKANDPSPILDSGRYWIVLRHSGEAIVNWFYIPGNPYSDGDDTRSTVKGYKWEDLLNYDFVFRVRGRVH